MAWGNCGTDSKGRPIGYAQGATCDEPGCKAKIDRGLSYACGGMHGDDDPAGSCERYFCDEHLVYTSLPSAARFCRSCADQVADLEDEDEDDEPPGPNGCTCGHNGDCNCPFKESA